MSSEPSDVSAYWDVASRVSAGNFARALVVHEFLIHFHDAYRLDPRHALRVGVLGGSGTEPEILALRATGHVVEATVFGLEPSDFIADFNVPPNTELDLPDFSLILSSQVIEHLWNHAAYFEWIGTLMKPETRIWLGAPCSNRPHGSPDYFAAGFTDTYLAANLERAGLTVLDRGTIGSQRLYNAALAEDLWMSVQSHKAPLLSHDTHGWPGRIARRVAHLPRLLRLSFTSGVVSSDLRWAVESWVWAEKASLNHGAE